MNIQGTSDKIDVLNICQLWRTNNMIWIFYLEHLPRIKTQLQISSFLPSKTANVLFKHIWDNLA